jgi:Putative Flp pilus-assembly TadE/G-like
MLNRQRGQTVPAWVASVLLGLTLTLFVFNYSNTMRWQIRAQNAADSAAVTLLAKDANAANSMSTLLYALSVQDFKMSAINNEIGALLKNDTLCVLQAPCSTNLSALLTQYTGYLNEGPLLASALTTFTSSLRNSSLVDQLGLQSQSNPNQYTSSFLNTLLSGGTCLNVLTNCAEGFQYSVAVVTSVPLVVDVVACKNVPTLAASFLHISNGTFKAVGRATVELAPLNSSTNAGSMISGLNGLNGILPQIPLGGSAGLGLGNINLAQLNVTTGYLIPAPVVPLNAANVPC